GCRPVHGVQGAGTHRQEVEVPGVQLVGSGLFLHSMSTVSGSNRLEPRGALNSRTFMIAAMIVRWASRLPSVNAATGEPAVSAAAAPFPRSFALSASTAASSD